MIHSFIEFSYFFVTGPSTWGKKVGRKWGDPSIKNNKLNDRHPSSFEKSATLPVAAAAAAGTITDTTPLIDHLGMDDEISNQLLQQEQQHNPTQPEDVEQPTPLPLPPVASEKKHQQRHRPAAPSSNKNGGAKRRVSRVESLRNLFSRSTFRTPPAIATVVPSSISTECLESVSKSIGEEQHRVMEHDETPPLAPPAPDVVQEAQNKQKLAMQLLCSSTVNNLRQPNRSFSLENVSIVTMLNNGIITPDVTDSGAVGAGKEGVRKGTHFPHSFIRSKLHRPLVLAGKGQQQTTPLTKPQPKSSVDLTLATSASCDDLTSSLSSSSGSHHKRSHPSLTASHQELHHLSSIRYRSVISVSCREEANALDPITDFKLVRRKRSFSLATLPVSASEAIQQQQQQQQQPSSSRSSEESGYESDATRNGSDSPRRIDPPPSGNSINVSFVSSLKAGLGLPLSADSKTPTPTPPSIDPPPPRCCNCRCGQQQQQQPLIEQQRSSRSGRHLPDIGGAKRRSSSLDRRQWLQPSTLVQIDDQETSSSSTNDDEDSLGSTTTSTDSSLVHLTTASLPTSRPVALPTPPPPPQRQFKMLRLVKGDSGELGIYINKKSSPDSGSAGYVIVGIEPGALAHR